MAKKKVVEREIFLRPQQRVCLLKEYVHQVNERHHSDYRLPKFILDIGTVVLIESPMSNRENYLAVPDEQVLLDPTQDKEVWRNVRYRNTCFNSQNPTIPLEGVFAHGVDFLRLEEYAIQKLEYQKYFSKMTNREKFDWAQAYKTASLQHFFEHGTYKPNFVHATICDSANTNRLIYANWKAYRTIDTFFQQGVGEHWSDIVIYTKYWYKFYRENFQLPVSLDMGN